MFKHIWPKTEVTYNVIRKYCMIARQYILRSRRVFFRFFFFGGGGGGGGWSEVIRVAENPQGGKIDGWVSPLCNISYSCLTLPMQHHTSFILLCTVAKIKMVTCTFYHKSLIICVQKTLYNLKSWMLSCMVLKLLGRKRINSCCHVRIC